MTDRTPVVEIATLTITPGQEEDFLAAYLTASDLVRQSDGCRSMRMTKGVESPSTFVLLIEWDSVADHETHFRETDRFGEWRAAIGPFFAAPPHIEHYATVGVPAQD